MTPTPPAARSRHERHEKRTVGRRTHGLNETTRRITHATVRCALPFFALPVAIVTILAAAGDASAQIADPTLPVGCTPQLVQTRLVEWDLTPLADAFGNAVDAVAGALVVDDRSSSRHSKLWFATRVGDTRAYRLTPGKAMKKDSAEAKSWQLGALRTGGVRLRPSGDGRFVFVNTNDDNSVNGALVAVDTSDNMRTTWLDRPQQEQMSDVSVDTRGGGNSAFTAAPVYDPFDFVATDFPTPVAEGVVQRLKPGQPKQDSYGKWTVPADVTRWPVGGGAGTCEDNGPGAPCIPGIVVDQRRGHPIFFSAPDFPNPNGTTGAIGELDPRPAKCNAYDQYNSCAKVRYWPVNPNLTAFPVVGPRHLLIDEHGRVWALTDSGQIVSLEIDRSYDRGVITIHNPRGPVEPEDLFAVAPDGGTIGFTDSTNDEVSVLFPKRVEAKVTPKIKFVKPVTRVLQGVREGADQRVHMVAPRVQEAIGQKYENPNDGTYVETNITTGTTESGSPVSSMTPTGMARDGARRTGSFFYGVTAAAAANLRPSNRVGHFEIKIEKDRELEHRRDDDDYDDDGDDDQYDSDDDGDGILDNVDADDDNDCEIDTLDKDDDNDGIENEHDSKSHRENKRTDRGSMAPGETKGYEMEANANSVLMLAIIEAATATTPLSIQIVDPNGVVVVSTPPALGKAVASATPALAGVYTVRVKNGGTASTTYKTTLIGRQIWF